MKAVIFDYGGVLAFPQPDFLIRFLCQSLSLSPQDIARGESHWLACAQEKGVPAGWPFALQSAIHQAIGLSQEMWTLVAELQTKLTVGLLSNLDTRFAKIVRRYGLPLSFSPCLFSCDTGLEKPHPAAYQLLVEQLPCPASEALFIDDKIENVAGAREVGLQSLHFESPEQVRKEILMRLE